MKKNAVVPYAIIAVLGILTVIIISFVGVNQRDDIQQAEEGGEKATEETQEGETSDDPEAIFESNCASCHGADLSGGAGPDLTKVGGNLSEEEIHDIIINGKGSMPPGMATEEEAGVLAGWLAEKK
ncbi:cytochrome c550 [Virgibacillus alimentarius]|uniref:Mono/diheme cytochrome c family protein n=1 Tax=Virgibacillus alimentarius TaxID=698769 RepID=A0ABS4S4V5_9BACI|nr:MULTISPECIES: cytochrome c [Virgibacillus]MBP2256530.1 mono/diheme cytochrome c family protein [Virgibacillus alimentarius]HLR66476.1 cytochrome c [Virgibacillus sp.]